MGDTKRQMLREMYRIRLFEERLKQFYDYTGFYGDGTIDSDAQTVEEMLTCVMYDFEKSGMIGGAVHLYIGEEAVAVGVCSHLRDTDNITSYHRGHGHALAKGLDFPGMMAELMGRATGYSQGFGGSMHIFDSERGMLGGNGIVGAQIPLALGPAFAAKYRGEDGVAVAFFGDGAANQGTLAEAMNIAAVWQLPIIFVCENNLWAASTPAGISHATEDIAPRAEGYDIPWAIVDGMDVMAVHEAASEAVGRARAGDGPTFLEAKTYRFESHAGGGRGTHQDPDALACWHPRDPICQFEELLIAEGIMTAEDQAAMREELAAELELSVEAATDSPFAEAEELGASYLPSTHSTRIEVREPAAPEPAPPTDTRELNYAHAVSEALREEMARDDRVFLIGEDLGPVREPEELWEQLRERRVFQTPISEAGFVGLATGAAAVGLRPVVEIMYCDFVTVCFDQIVNQAAKLKLMSGNRINVPLVIKTPAGSGTREGGHHSGSHEAWFMHTPGLKVVMPSSARDAKGLLKSAIRDDGPVVFIQHRLLHRMDATPVPDGEYLVPIGVGEVKRTGSDITVVAYSYALQKALRAAEALAGEISVEVVDPRTLAPLDLDCILASVAKTGRLLVVHDAPQRGGAGAEIVRQVTAAGFDLLQIAPQVLAGADTAMPYSPPLEDACIPQPLDIVRLVREITN